MDYLVGKHFASWMLGGTGYALKQVTDDAVNGVTVLVPTVIDAGLICTETPANWSRPAMGAELRLPQLIRNEAIPRMAIKEIIR